MSAKYVNKRKKKSSYNNAKKVFHENITHNIVQKKMEEKALTPTKFAPDSTRMPVLLHCSPISLIRSSEGRDLGC